ncbi:MAG: hypothetical protein FJW37_00945, partial [Acidobacteria bacterium]|nr:hypothetical protein [Acidobacteriota bacterium]
MAGRPSNRTCTRPPSTNRCRLPGARAPIFGRSGSGKKPGTGKGVMAKKLKVLLLFKQQHDLRDHWVTDLLEALGSRHQLVEYDYSRPPAAQFAGVDAVIDQGGGQGTREMADHCGSVKLWQVLGTGFDQLDIDYWRKKGIPVANTPGVFSAV